MIKFLCLVVLSLTCVCHSIQCYNGKLWRKVPIQVLPQLGMTLNDAVDYPSKCEKAYKAAKKLRKHDINTSRKNSTAQQTHPVVYTASKPLSVVEQRNYENDWLITLAGIGIFALFVIWEIKLTIGCFRDNTDSDNYPPKCARNCYTETPTYEELLLRPEWRQFRKRAFKRYGRTCAICGCSECRLNVHHNYYLKDDSGFVYPWEYPLTAVSILCDDCHYDWHQSHKNLVYNISRKV